jgi:nucleotide-binding universal stress UspA family protein
MISITNILVPVVFSRRCAWAARYAARLAQTFGSQLVFLNVGKENDAGTLEQFVSKEISNVPRKCVVMEGDPADRITELAQEYRADLIVMPTYHGRFRTFLIGSVTAKVLHDVECPVLTGVHRYDDSPQIPATFRNVVCALDDAQGCISVFHWAREFASPFGMHLRLVHAIPAVDEISDNCGEIEVRRYLLSQAKKHFAARFAAEPEQPTIALRGGDIAKVIRETALAEQADLVIIGRGHADRALGRLRSHTYNIIRNAPCPVISV